MSKEIKINKKEYDSSGAPPPTPEFQEQETNEINEYFIICHKCSSSIEILSINENNNIIEFRCTKENKNYTISIKEYLEKVKEYKEKNINDLKDKCEKHKNNNYVSYCYECNCHLCDECLKTRIHINHKKSNIIEIKPVEEEIDVIQKVIKDYKKRLEKVKNEKENKTKEIDVELEKEKNNEKNKLKDIKKSNEKNKNEELEICKTKYIEAIEKIKKKYENEIKLRRNEYENEKKNINNKYKLINEEEIIKYNNKLEKLKNKYNNMKNKYNFDNMIENYDNMLKINEAIFNIYNTYNNNYYNGININNLLLYYSKNDYINDNIMRNILENNYDEIINKINIKKNEYNKLKKEIKDDKMNDEIKKIEDKYKNEINKIEDKYKNEIKNIEDKYKNEINILKKNINQNILYNLYNIYIF